MREQLYTIPVNDGFSTSCECPVCAMYDSLEKDAINFVMGPSYMQDDIRMETNKTGFCSHHIKLMYKNQNRLGLALMLHTHMQRTNRDLEDLLKNSKPAAKKLFSKAKTESPITDYIKQLNESCYVCNRIDQVFNRYIATIFHCYKQDKKFPDKIKQSRGFCTKHFGLLYEKAPEYLSGKTLDDFISTISYNYLQNMKRVTDDVEWFTDKFDYKNADAPWKNAKDAIPRAMTKTNSIIEE